MIFVNFLQEDYSIQYVSNESHPKKTLNNSSLDDRFLLAPLIEVKQKIFSRTPWDHRKLCDIDMF